MSLSANVPEAKVYERHSCLLFDKSANPVADLRGMRGDILLYSTLM